jgi:hypothetical protein
MLAAMVSEEARRSGGARTIVRVIFFSQADGMGMVIAKAKNDTRRSRQGRVSLYAMVPCLSSDMDLGPAPQRLRHRGRERRAQQGS